jgi:hypothetical protein
MGKRVESVKGSGGIVGGGDGEVEKHYSVECGSKAGESGEEAKHF